MASSGSKFSSALACQLRCLQRPRGSDVAHAMVDRMQGDRSSFAPASFFATQKITMAAAGAVWGEYPADRGDQWLE